MPRFFTIAVILQHSGWSVEKPASLAGTNLVQVMTAFIARDLSVIMPDSFEFLAIWLFLLPGILILCGWSGMA